MRKIKEFLIRGISPVVTIIIIALVGIFTTAGILAYVYLWHPVEPQSQSINKIEWRTYSENANLFSFEYPNQFCTYPGVCQNVKIITTNDNSEIFLGLQHNKYPDQISPVFKIYFVQDINNKKEVEEYINELYKNCLKVKSWDFAGYGEYNDKIVERISEFELLCNPFSARLHAAYSESRNTLVMFDLMQLGMACLSDNCKIDQKFFNSIKIDGVSVYQESIE